MGTVRPGIIRYGTSSWSEKSWVGPFYPPGTAAGDYLNYYATQFSTVEADVTYYRIPDRRLVTGWDDKTPDGFVLSAKFPRSIVHCGDGAMPNSAKLLLWDQVGDDTREFLSAMDLLGPKCGPLVLQFPYFNKRVFKNAAEFRDRLATFLDALPSRFRYAVEIRNKYWLDAALLDLLRERRVALVLLDLVYMPHPDQLPDLNLITTDFTFVRLIGDRKAVDERTETFDRIVLDQSDRLRRWATLLRGFMSDVPAAYVYANNHYAGHGPATIRELVDQLPKEMLSPMNKIASHWQLDPETVFLNHGSFGACPTPVLQYQADLRTRIERQPVAFFVRELEAMVDAARQALGAFLGIPNPEDLVFVTNATSGVNTVLKSLTFAAGDELLTTNHVYNACHNTLKFVAARFDAKIVVADTPFPIADPDEFVHGLLGRVTARTRLVLLDHITSPTGLVLPAERVLPELHDRGIETLVDGAHAPGMIDLDIGALQPTYYTGNCHKWLCCPKGAAFLYVRRDRQRDIRPLTISHGANSPRTDRSRFLLEFDWPGTGDPTAFLCVPEALRFLGSLFPGGFAELRQRNRDLVLTGRRILCEGLQIDAPAPESMIGSLASVPLPAGRGDGSYAMAIDPLQDQLFAAGIEVPVMPFPAPPSRVLRISAQAYNDESQYQRLADSLLPLLG